MALVQVDERGADTELREHPHPADPEDGVLRESGVPVTDVEARGDPTVDRVIVVAVGVEQIESDASDVDAPHLHVDFPAADPDRHRQGSAVGSGDAHRRHPVEGAVEPILVLPAASVETLVKIALTVRQSDPDHGKRQIGGGLQQIARQYAEPAAVHRQRAVDGELRAEVGDRSLGAERTRARRTTEVGRQRRRGGADARDVALSARELSQAMRGRDLDEIAWIADAPPRGFVDVAEERGRPRLPDPSIVVGEACQRRDLGRQLLAELGDHPRNVAPPVGVGCGHALA